MFRSASKLVAPLLIGLFLLTAVFLTESIARGGGSNTVYLPAHFKPDLFAITHIELSQAIQDNDNTVPMVANRPTVVRVFTQVPTNTPNVTMTLSATRNGNPLGNIAVGPQTATNSTKNELASTFNFILPADWLNGTVNLSVSNSVTSELETTAVTFNDVPPLNIVLVPVNYTHTPNGQTFPGPTNDHISDWIRRTYPVSQVNLTVRPAINFSGNLGEFQDWNFLLGDVDFAKTMDSAPYSTVYYGFVIRDCGWFTCGGGIVGVGGGRSAVGLDYGPSLHTSTLAGHEIGHALGRGHSPCNVSGDPGFPYAGGGIGQFGIDGIASGTLQIIDPSIYKDVMGYCNPDWVSDYTYVGLYQDQLTNGRPATVEPTDSLTINGTFAEDGSITLQPIYRLEQVIQTAVSPTHRIDLLDSNGNIIGHHLVEAKQIESGEQKGMSISTAVPLPKTAVATVQLVDLASENILAQQTMTTSLLNSSRPTVQKAGETAVLQWGNPNQPVVIRHSADGGASWTAVALNHLGGTFTMPQAVANNGMVEILLGNSTAVYTIQLDQ